MHGPDRDDKEDDVDFVVDLSSLDGTGDVDEGVTSGADLGDGSGPFEGFVDTVHDNASEHDLQGPLNQREDIDVPGGQNGAKPSLPSGNGNGPTGQENSKLP
jgi:hypothetical protein